MLGSIEVLEQTGMTKFPQKAASAWAAFDSGITGAGYKPLLYVGTQLVKGVNHVFIAEQTLILAQPVRHIVIVVINEFENNFSTVNIEKVI